MAAPNSPASTRPREPLTQPRGDISLGPYFVSQVPSGSTVSFAENEDNSQEDRHTLLEDATLAAVQGDNTSTSATRPVKSKRFWYLNIYGKPVAIVITVIMFSSVLSVVLVVVFRQPIKSSLFQGTKPKGHNGSMYVLVNLSDTWLVYIASILNIVTPLVAGYLMSLYTPHITYNMRLLSARGFEQQLPKPQELRFIAGVSQASVFQLTKYYWRRLRRRIRKPSTPLQDITLKFGKIQFMCFAILAAVAVLHFTTETITFEEISINAITDVQAGYGLSYDCLVGDRTAVGYPCSYNTSNPELGGQLRRRFALEHNTSSYSEITLARQHEFDGRELHILIPRTEQLDASTDYRATSIGISTECSYITEDCSLRYASSNMSDAGFYYTIFNCSEGFYGVLGKIPQLNNWSTTAGDSDIPELNYKPSSRLQLGYYVDPSLNYVYNSVGYDPSTLFPSMNIEPLSDAQLAFPLYLAVAARIGFVGLGGEFDGNSDAFVGHRKYVEFAVRCRMSSFDIEYTRYNDSLQDIIVSPMDNGTALEIFHGAQFYSAESDVGAGLLELLSQVSVQPSTDAIARKWEKLFSIKALSVIGAVTTGRNAITHQTRIEKLVAQIPWPALGAVIICSLMFVWEALQILQTVYQGQSVHRIEEGDILLADQISTPGLIFSAFLDPADSLHAQGKLERAAETGFKETTRVKVDARLPGQFRLETVDIAQDSGHRA